ncbi:hypothetical protein LRU_00903 [Ligilactobacillus ruminis SPM0211]|uniref:Uncharacterized protein n=1 Tax=Ligilactobacillus ruminis SPM0211 TaxID=1040964 RepID=F7QZP7_9LACO|nr:hypothetical protein LRU_00903 [Ligilactobacillus ruminis SPM0211]
MCQKESPTEQASLLMLDMNRCDIKVQLEWLINLNYLM